MKPALRIAKSHVPLIASGTASCCVVQRIATTPVEHSAREPVRLQPIPWGKPDPVLARALCWQIRELMPETVIPFNPLTPLTHRKLRTYLREHGFSH